MEKRGDKGGAHMKPKIGQVFEVGITGACYLISKKVALNKTIRYGLHHQGEDLEWCYSAAKAGYKLYCDGSILTNHVMKRYDGVPTPTIFEYGGMLEDNFKNLLKQIKEVEQKCR